MGASSRSSATTILVRQRTASRSRSDRANHWLDKGALPSDTVRSLLRRAGILKVRHEARVAKKLQGSAVPLKTDE